MNTPDRPGAGSNKAIGDEPLVSVILPVYNGERFVGQTIESALCQTYRNLEIIVIDDGSTDRTLNVVESLAASDSRVRYVRQANGGVASARNRGLAEARGEFVAPLDADDLWDPMKIERQVHRLQEAGDRTGMVYCWWVWIDEAGKVLDRSPRWEIEGDTESMLLQINFTGNASVPLYRRRCLEEIGGYDEGLERQGGRGCEDWDVALKVAARFGVAVVRQLLVGYRRLPDSMSTQCSVMQRSQKLLTSGLQQRVPDVAPELLRRSDDQFTLYIASVFFRSGNYVRSFAWAMRAWRTGLLFRILPYVMRFLLQRILPGRRAKPEVMRPGTSLESCRVPDPLIPYDRIYGVGPAESPPQGAAAWLRSRILQSGLLVLSFLFVAAVHFDNDGLWFQGDAPRHAANGLFWYDLLAAAPSSITDFAVRYYARYPIINPVTYPPLFYIVEGLGFHAFGPSPYVAKGLILALSILAGFFTMAWARRWLGPGAGWTGAFLAFVPGFVIWTNTVMPNIPATALGVAGLYYWRRWYDSGERKHLLVSACLAAATVLTYYQGGITVAICAAWGPMLQPVRQTIRRTRYAVAATAVFATAPVIVAAVAAPVFLARHLPAFQVLKNPETWTYYTTNSRLLLGSVLLALGLIGLVAGFWSAHWRKEAQLIAAWIVTPLVIFSLLPARDTRYILIVVPAFLLAAAIGIACLLRSLSAISPRWQVAALLAGFIALGWHASQFRMPRKEGFRDVASYLSEHAPNDAVLYDGYHDGLFGFYFRSFDPHYRRRLVLGQQLLYHYGPATNFNWVETLKATSTQNVVDILRNRSGCSWVAIEVGPFSEWAEGQRLLRAAVAGPQFELVRSFPVVAPNAQRVDLYHLVGGALPVSTVDLQLASFSSQTFRNVTPIASR